MVLIRLAYDGSDSRASGTPNNGSFDALAEECAQDGPTCSADEGSFAWTDAALLAVTVIVLTVVVSAVVVSAIVVLAVVVSAVVVSAIVVLAVVVSAVVVSAIVVLAVVVSAVVVSRVAVVPAAAAAANAVVERLVVSVIAVVVMIPVLSGGGKDAGRQQQQGDELRHKLVDHLRHGPMMRICGGRCVFIREIWCRIAVPTTSTELSWTSIPLERKLLVRYALRQRSDMEIPIACNLSDSELWERRQTILNFFRQNMVKVRPLPLGLAFSFQPSSEVLTRLAELVDLERRCCPFLTFRIVVEAGDLPIRLEVIGTAAVKEVIANLFGFSDGEQQIPPD
jgi:hypothetical protein